MTLVPNLTCTIGRTEMLKSQWRESSWIFPLLTHNPLHLTGVLRASDPTSRIKLIFHLEQRNSCSVQIYMHHKVTKHKETKTSLQVIETHKTYCIFLISWLSITACFFLWLLPDLPFLQMMMNLLYLLFYSCNNVTRFSKDRTSNVEFYG